MKCRIIFEKGIMKILDANGKVVYERTIDPDRIDLNIL